MNGNVYTHGFLVDDLDAAIRFYESKLGFRVKRRTQTFAAMETNAPSGLFFWQYAHIFEHLGQEAAGKVRHRQMIAMLYETREQVDARVEELLLDGVELVAAPQEWAWNAYAAYLVDCKGFLWELWTWN